MYYIAHRINTLAQLKALPEQYGLEVDLRDYGDRIVLQHDPYVEAGAEDFESLLDCYHHGTLILNIKSERIEPKVQEMLASRGIEDYFFLDSSFPMIRNLSALGEHRFAVRFSEYEPIEYALSLAGAVNWVWVDCFNRLPLDAQSHAQLRQHFKICIVSPELQGHSLDSIPAFASQISGLEIDAVCTKRPDLWQQAIRPKRAAA
ncbi:MAG TPA: hypothetical protein DDW52_05410 [Planctomycetaceae bacterium]|nr:hypothetical protein [Planctomycetaceae bacterium]